MSWRDSAKQVDDVLGGTIPTTDNSVSVREPVMRENGDLAVPPRSSWRNNAKPINADWRQGATPITKPKDETGDTNPDNTYQNQTNDFAQGYVSPFSGQGGLRDILDQTAVPAVKFLQKNIGEPVARAFKNNPMTGVSSLPQGVQGLLQQGTAWLHGKDVESQEMRNAVGRIVGPEHVGLALQGATMVGQVPLWLALPETGLESAVDATAPILSKVATSFYNGVINGTYGTVVGNALTKGKPLTDDVASNALVSGGLFGIARGSFEGGKKLLGIISKRGLEAFGDELNTILTSPPKKTKLGESLVEAGAPSLDSENVKNIEPTSADSPRAIDPETSLKLKNNRVIKSVKQTEGEINLTDKKQQISKTSNIPKNFEPVTGVVSRSEDGLPTITVHEVTIDPTDGKSSLRSTKFSLRTDTDAIAFRQLKQGMAEFPVQSGGMDYSDMGPLWHENVFGKYENTSPHELSLNKNNKMQAVALDTPTPSGNLQAGSTIDVHVPGEPLHQDEVTNNIRGTLETKSGNTLQSTQAVVAPKLPDDLHAPVKAETNSGKTIHPHADVAPIPIPQHRIPVPGELPDTLLNNFTKGVQLIKNAASNVTSKAGDLLEKYHLVQPSMRLNIPVNVQAALLALHGAPRVEKLRGDYLRSIFAQIGTKEPSQDFTNALGKYIESNSGEDLAHLNNTKEWWAAKSFMQQQLTARSLDSARVDNLLSRAGFSPMSKEGSGLGDQYVARLFMAHMKLPWAEQAKALDLVEPAIKEVMQTLAKRGEDIPEHQVRQWVDNALHGKSTFDTFKAQVNSETKAFKNLKSRAELGPAMRDALGEVHDGITRMAYSRATQTAIINRLEMMETLSQDVQVTSASEVPGWQKVPSTKQYGMMAGKYVRPDIWGMISPENIGLHSPDSIARKLIGYRKQMLTNPIWAGLGALSHHIYNSEVLGMIGSRPSNPIAIGRDYVTAQRALYEYAKNPNGSGLAELAKLATDLGPLSGRTDLFNLKANEDRIYQNHIARNEKLVNSDNPPDIHDLLHEGSKTALKLGATVLGGLNEAGKKFYNWNIDAIRLSNFIGARNQLLTRDHDGLFSNLARELASSGASMEAEKFQQWARSDIESLVNRLAARRVMLSTANSHTMAPIAQKLSKSTVGSGVTFTTPLAETARVLAQMPVRFATDANYRWNVATGLAALGAVAAIKRSTQWLHGGMSPDVLSRAASLETDSKLAGKPFLEQMPSAYASSFKDSKGRVEFEDDSLPLQAIEELMRGNPQDPIAARLTQNLADHFIPGSGEIAHNIMTQAGITKPGPQYKPRPGEGTMMSLVHGVASAANYGLVPKTFANMSSATDGTGLTQQIGPNQEQLTPAQGLRTAAGLGRPQPVTVGDNSPSLRAKVAEQKAQERDATTALHNKTSTPEQRQRSLQELRKILQQRQRINK